MKHTSSLSWVIDRSWCEASVKSVIFSVIAYLKGDFPSFQIRSSFGDYKAKHALVGSFVMLFDYNVPIPVEKVSKKVQMERYQPFQNSLEARQFHCVMLRATN